MGSTLFSSSGSALPRHMRLQQYNIADIDDIIHSSEDSEGTAIPSGPLLKDIRKSRSAERGPDKQPRKPKAKAQPRKPKGLSLPGS